MALDPKRLIELLRIAECGSYTRAAASLGVSQPALSNSIAVLEKSLGVRLFDRTPRGATLTDHGRLLASHAEALQRLLSRADDDLQLKKLGMEGSLAVGISPIASVELVPNAIARLTQEAPNISVGIYERPDAELLSGLLRGEIDAVISPLGAHPRSPDIDCEVLLQDIAVVIVRPQNPIAQRNLVGIKELSEERWVMPSPHTAMWEHTRTLFAAANVPWPANYITTNSINALTAGDADRRDLDLLAEADAPGNRGRLFDVHSASKAIRARHRAAHETQGLSDTDHGALRQHRPGGREGDEMMARMASSASNV